MKRLSGYDKAVERLNQYVEAHNMRPSPTRMEVLEQVFLLPQPFTAPQLVEACEEKHISRGTIFNALRLFITAQILHALNRQRGQSAAEYEVMTSSQSRMQLICEKCGRTADFKDIVLERILRERRFTNFSLRNYSLYVYGECKICRSRKTKKTN